MDVIRINPATWLPDALVEGYSSFIWTERYQDTGEFELKTFKVDEIRALIPEKSFIGLRDAQEVMMVETHAVEDTSDGPELTVTGRTFEAFLEQRTTVVVNVTPGASAMWTYAADDIWPTDAAKALIMSHVTVSTEGPNQAVPNTTVANLITDHVGEEMSYENEPGILYDQVINLLKMEDAGIRNQLDFVDELHMYIYSGIDRTVNQSEVEPVVFNLDAKHIINEKYLWTIKDYKNLAYVVGDAWQQRVYAPGVTSGVAGLNRRILFVDGNEIKSASSTTKKTKQATALGLAALAKQNQTIFFDGEVSPTSPYVRGVDYNLGDKVTLMAHYGISQTMNVSEFVRTDDQEGERAYPTLVVPGEFGEE